MKRLFFAIPFPADVQTALHTAALHLKRHIGGRAVRNGNYHLTLRFLGECDLPREQAALRALGKMREVVPFILTVGNLGYFCQGDRALVWMKADGEQALSELHAELEKVLKQEDFQPERKPFFPHVTLLRDVPCHKIQESAPENERQVSVSVAKVVLFESVNGSQGLVYKVVAAS